MAAGVRPWLAALPAELEPVMVALSVARDPPHLGLDRRHLTHENQQETECAHGVSPDVDRPA